MKKVASGPVA